MASKHPAENAEHSPPLTTMASGSVVQELDGNTEGETHEEALVELLADVPEFADEVSARGCLDQMPCMHA